MEEKGLEKAEDFINLTKRIKGIDINLQLEKIGDSLKLSIRLTDIKTKEPPAKTKIMLYFEGRELESVESNEATFYLKFKKYFIKIFVGGKQIGIINLGLTKEY